MKKSSDTKTMELASRVRQERKSQNLSQTELANIAGVSLNFLSQLESGKSTVQYDKVLQVLGALGLELKIQYQKTGLGQ